MGWIHLDPIVSWILRLALGALFATAAAHKIRDPRGFQRTLSDYEILPRTLLTPAAIGLVTFEVLISIDLLTGFVTGFVTELEASTIGASLAHTASAPSTHGPWAGVAAGLLLTIYALAIGINLLRGRNEIDCGCLGPAARQPLSSWLLLRNVILALGAVMTSLPASDRGLHAIDGITLLGGFIALSLLFNTVNLLSSDPTRWATPESSS